MPDISSQARGLTVADLALLLRVGEDKIRLWIKAGELMAVNTAATLASKPRWIVLPRDLDEFQRRRSGATPPKPARRRYKKISKVDYFPDK
jgi:Helix-turn-helix domain